MKALKSLWAVNQTTEAQAPVNRTAEKMEAVKPLYHYEKAANEAPFYP